MAASEVSIAVVEVVAKSGGGHERYGGRIRGTDREHKRPRKRFANAANKPQLFRVFALSLFLALHRVGTISAGSILKNSSLTIYFVYYIVFMDYFSWDCFFCLVCPGPLGYLFRSPRFPICLPVEAHRTSRDAANPNFISIPFFDFRHI